MGVFFDLSLATYFSLDTVLQFRSAIGSFRLMAHVCVRYLEIDISESARRHPLRGEVTTFIGIKGKINMKLMLLYFG